MKAQLQVIRLLASIASSLVVWAACGDGSRLSGPGRAFVEKDLVKPQPHVSSGAAVEELHCVTLIAGKTITVGTVCIINSQTELLVRYQTSDGWQLSETQVAVAAHLNGLPRTKKGNPRVGHFPYKSVHHPRVPSFIYEIALDAVGVAPGRSVVIAAHAEVLGPLGEREGAWARGIPFTAKGSWAMFVSHALGTDILAAAFIGPDGGTISSAGGDVSLTVAPASLASSTAITIEAGASPGENEGVIPGTSWEFGPAGLAFDPPAELTMKYVPGDLPVGLTDPAASLTLGKKLDGLWQEIVSSVDGAAHRVTASIPGFSHYAMLSRICFIRISPASVELEMGEEVTFVAEPISCLTGEQLHARWLAWGSSDPAVVELDVGDDLSRRTALATAVREGQATVAVIGVIGGCPDSPFILCQWPPAGREPVVGSAEVTVVTPPGSSGLFGSWTGTWHCDFHCLYYGGVQLDAHGSGTATWNTSSGGSFTCNIASSGLYELPNAPNQLFANFTMTCGNWGPRDGRWHWKLVQHLNMEYLEGTGSSIGTMHFQRPH